MSNSVMAPGQGTGFVSVGDYLDANQGTIANEVGQINANVGGQIDAAKSSADALTGTSGDYTALPGYKDSLDKAIAAKNQATALQTPGGVADYFKSNFHDNQGQSEFDANLLGPNRFSGLQQRASGLTDYLNSKASTPPPPPPPAPPLYPTGPGPNGVPERTPEKQHPKFNPNPYQPIPKKLIPGPGGK